MVHVPVADVQTLFVPVEGIVVLHDELVVVKEQFDTTATYTLSNTSGQERTLRISAKYITKSGMLEQIYIPPNGVFSLQLTFGISYYMV